MKILIDISHPAHVHVFKHLTYKLQSQGHEVLFTTRIKDVAHQLLNEYKFKYISFGENYKKPWGKIWGLIRFDIKLFFVALRFKPDLFIAIMSVYASHVAFLLRKPHILLSDTEHAKWLHRLSFPFATSILTPTIFYKPLGKKQVKYNSYHELAYMHPDLFTPDPSYDPAPDQKDNRDYVIIRFVSWTAAHDIGYVGIPTDYKIQLVEALAEKVRVFISSEGELPENLIKYKMKIPPEQIHNTLANAKLVITEGTTVGSESASLGTPTIVVNILRLGYIDELDQKYGLIVNFRSHQNLLEKSLEMISNPDLKSEWKIKQQRMLKEKVNLTDYLYKYLKDNHFT